MNCKVDVFLYQLTLYRILWEYLSQEGWRGRGGKLYVKWSNFFVGATKFWFFRKLIVDRHLTFFTVSSALVLYFKAMHIISFIFYVWKYFSRLGLMFLTNSIFAFLLYLYTQRGDARIRFSKSFNDVFTNCL